MVIGTPLYHLKPKRCEHGYIAVECPFCIARRSIHHNRSREAERRRRQLEKRNARLRAR
jgi:hypothetical protein